MKRKEEIKLDFFKKFDNESFRGYPLEQCNSIWDFFEKHIQCQEDMDDVKYTKEDMIKFAIYYRNNVMGGSLIRNMLSDFNNLINKQD